MKINARSTRPAMTARARRNPAEELRASEAERENFARAMAEHANPFDAADSLGLALEWEPDGAMRLP